MINRSVLKRQINRIVKMSPTNIELKRIIEVPDGYKGYIKQEELVKALSVFLSFKDKTSISININDSGINESVKNITLIVIYDDTFEVLKDDFFILGEKKYKIMFVENKFDVYWECILEVV